MILYVDNKVLGTIPNSCKVLFVEGYEMTGKSYFIDHLNIVNSTKKVVWKFPKDVPPTYKYIPAEVMLGMLDQDIIDSNTLLVVDRGLISSIVYNIMYDDQKNIKSKLCELLEKYYKNNNKIYNIYITHTESTVKLLYDKSSNDKIHNYKYDKFNDVISYYAKYLVANNLFLQYLEEYCKDNYSIITALDYKVCEGLSG